MFKTKFTLLIFLIFVSSCKRFFTDDELVTVFEGTLISSLSFESKFLLNPKFPANKDISRPIGVWQRLITTDNFCVDYRIPSKKKKGILSLAKTNSFGVCPTLPVITPVVILENISEFKMSLSNDFISGKKIRNGTYGFKFNYKYKSEPKSLSISLMNMERQTFPEKENYKKYESFGSKRWKKGLRVTRSSQRKLRTKLWPSGIEHNDDSKAPLIFCERVDNSCKTIETNTCSECLKGWLPVVDFNCPNGGSKVCAPLPCGRKGMPACPRGTRWKGVEMHDLCFDESPAGFCVGELKTMCDENKVLICI